MPIQISALYKNAFKDADIRGIYPKELDEEVVYLIARAFVDEYTITSLVVGRDMRLSSDALYDAFCRGVVDAGASVIDLGLVSTPMVYFASGTLSLPGAMITASHSPKDHNGLKLVLPGAIPLTEKHGLGALRRRIEKGVFSDGKKIGKIKAKDIKKAYQAYVLKGIPAKNWQGIKVVADCGNGMASVVMPLLAEKLPVTFTTILAELDGRFPNRGSDPTLRKNQRVITKKLEEGKHDFGIAFDGDCDRIAFFDERGQFVNCAVIGALVAERLLKKQPKAKIVYTTLTSRIYEERIRAAHGVPVLARVGHAFIKETMRQKDVLFGCEHSGHYYYKDFFYTDSVELTLRYVLEAYQEARLAGKTFSQLIEPYRGYMQIEDTIVMVDNQKKALAAVYIYLMAKKPKRMKKFDGYAVDFGDVWGSVKISVTEPALKMMFESRQKKLAAATQADLVAFVQQIAHE